MFLCLFKTIVKFHDSLNDSVIVLKFRNNRNFRKRRGLLEVGHLTNKTRVLLEKLKQLYFSFQTN
jgi:hypothetical protein